jgi:putative transposase
LLLAPEATASLEKVMQFLKGAYAHRQTKETGSRLEIWERSFTNYRIRDWEDYEKHRAYILSNPVRAGLCRSPEEYAFCSSCPGFLLDPAPQRLKPVS